jgi:hypothetical protein
MATASSFTILDEKHDSLIGVEYCKEVSSDTVEVSIDGTAATFNRQELLEAASLFERMAQKLPASVVKLQEAS